MKFLSILTMLSCLFLFGCGGGGPSDSEVEEALKASLENFHQATMGTSKIKINDIEVGDINKVDGTEDTYEVEVTIDVDSNVMGMKQNGKKSTVIKMRKINGNWVVMK